jgi:arylsulfatase A-like enzyme
MKPALALLSLVPLSAALAAPARPPNIIHIVADDLGYDDIEPYGCRDIHTPNLTRMTRQGMMFTSFYAPSPICTPSRAALMTGCYAPRIGLPRVLFPYSNTGLNAGERTIGHLLRDAGYATAVIGKWHLGHDRQFLPQHRGFDRFFGIAYPADHGPERVRWDAEDGRPDWRPPPVALFRDDDIVEQPAGLETLPHRLTVEAVRFIKENKDRPFFLHFSNLETHTPWFTSPRFHGLSRAGAYGDAVRSLDWTIGEIEAVLIELGLVENTLLVFTSDNGPLRHNPAELAPIYGRFSHVDVNRPHVLRGAKGSGWEGGVRVPCIMAWKNRIPAGAVNHDIAAGMDLYTTFAKIAGAEPPRDRKLDGVDLSPLLFAQPGARPPRDTFFYHRENVLAAVREGRWKLVFAADGPLDPPAGPLPPPRLFDLAADLGETTDLAARHPEIVARLEALADAARADLGDSWRGVKGRGCREPGVALRHAPATQNTP